MKHTPEQYLDCGFYTQTEDETLYSSKIVKVRKEHICSFSQVVIPKGEIAFFEKCLLDKEWVTSYTSLEVLDKWIEGHT